MVKTSIRTAPAQAGSRSPSGRSTVTDTPGSLSTTKRNGMSPPSSSTKRSLAGLACDRLDDSELTSLTVLDASNR